MKKLNFLRATLMLLLLAGSYPGAAPAWAHGERAQQPGLRMRTVHWFDTQASTTKLDVNEVVTVKGRFMPSVHWPDHLAPITATAFLNVGIPGPVFIRVDSRVNGVPMIRSTSFALGSTYEYEIMLKARTPGRYHVHPVISVEGVGPVIGPGIWVEVSGNQAEFVNTVTTLTGDKINLETYGLSTIYSWSALWIVISLVWFGYWLTKCPLVMPRYKRVNQLGDDADTMLTPLDRKIGILFFTLTLTLIAAGYIWGQENYPTTTPLQTGKVEVPLLPLSAPMVEVKLDDARYRIPGRSFQVKMTVTNHGQRPLQLGQFSIANVRFINPKVLTEKPVDSHDLVAPRGLRVEGEAIAPGETRELVVYAEDALWETQRLTRLIYDPDSRFAALLFFYDDKGNRYHREIGGYMLPVFI